ncbi:FkbM family methyltransferase [Stratiformator vulcanicus]|uniref:Methyltransferase FkbM domain-containing protein n=1 Tax=Stratiformator vulcanicus TaxID=2527980 RepID=A0A517QXS1_9PLAN|nr:FkbM family methyltransferase [Stratiformator vulcanicus]QDT36370.1 hypothetical protein Pan189_07260 [Stratiformator vulcanicus]
MPIDFNQPLNPQYDEQTAEMIRRVLPKDGCGVDIGAHAGDILQHMLSVASEGIVYGFEPIPALAEGLRMQFPDAKIFEVALSNTTGTGTFKHVVNAQAYSGLQRRDYDRPDVIVNDIEVQIRRLDEVIGETQKVDIIKLDIEGGEYSALEGAENVITRSRPHIIFEASVRSTGRYGVEPKEFYALLTKKYGLHLTTMDRWLDGVEPITPDEFAKFWHEGPHFYFLASPLATAVNAAAA